MGLLMTTVAMLTLIPGNVGVSEVNAFRIYGGIGLLIAGILIAVFKGQTIPATIILLNGVLFIIAGEISIAADSPIILAFAIAYVVLALISLLSEEKTTLMSVLMVLMALNLITRYFMPSDGVYYVSGVFCALSAILAFYIGIATISEKVKLPVF